MVRLVCGNWSRRSIMLLKVQISNLFLWILVLMVFVPHLQNPFSLDVRYNCEVEEKVEATTPVPSQIQNAFGLEGDINKDGELVRKLPQGFIHETTNFNLHNISTSLEKDIAKTPKSLLAIAVGAPQNASVDAIIQKFPKEHFQVMLFHYDNHVDGWSDFEWNDRAIHVQGTGQTKWWFSKRFLHPDVVEPYEYIFVWDEDLGVSNFDPLKFLEIMKKNDLQIAQPAVDKSESWPITQRLEGREMHTRTSLDSLPEECTDTSTHPPCAGFVEIQAPVFARKAWGCVWHLIQNDLVLAWGLDFHLHKCVDGVPHEHMGVVDAEWIQHNSVDSLATAGGRERRKVTERSHSEWDENTRRWNAGLN